VLPLNYARAGISIATQLFAARASSEWLTTRQAGWNSGAFAADRFARDRQMNYARAGISIPRSYSPRGLPANG
ncbi:MAG TPA: hypothetical protein VN769_01740, partial [Xanthobacteraceae bacterium]|nr:hypothetical protein [Xanthobacteraceae bacterium]